MKRLGFLFGAAFGAVIAAGRLNEYNVIHDALRLTNLYVFFVMGSAVVVAMPLLYILRRRNWSTLFGGQLDLSHSPIERKHIYGGIVFGTGWAITGTCPAPALAMIGAGGALGLFVVAGIFFGLLLRDVVAERTSSSTQVDDTGATAPAGRPAHANLSPVVDL
ncbi:MAG: hypothetical protein NVSMB52_19580 [Chloroflexota bacterium]